MFLSKRYSIKAFIKMLPFFMIFCLVFLSISCKSKNPETKNTRPNIVFIIADDMGIGDVGVYGQDNIETPNIDRLARQGMQFENFYAGSTVCAPSRATLMTGQHTGTTKIRGNGEFPLAPEKRILPELLKENGYTNAMFGKWGLGLEGTSGSPEKRGWDVFLGHLHHVSAHFQTPDSLDAIKNGEIVKQKVEEDSYANDLFAKAAVDFIEEQPAEKPFFLYLSLTLPHAELLVPQRYIENYLTEEGKSVFAPEKAWPDGRHYGPQKYPKAAYAAMVSSVDDYVGQVMQTLKKKGLAENTIVVFTSDNGTHIEGGRSMEDVEFFESSGIYRGIKRDLYAGGIRMPFIVRWPEKIEAGSETDHVAAFWDVYPTFADLLNIPIEQENIDGISFLPTLLDQGNQKKHEYLYWEFYEDGGKQAILKGNWKAVRLNINKTANPPIELYNIEKDPGEKNNLADKYPKKAEKLGRLMDSISTPNKIFKFEK